MMKTHPTARTARRGFSLIELLLAIFILGIGIISIAAVFPAGIIQQRRAQDDVLGPVVAEEAMAVIRSRVNPEDFGTFEEFGIYGPGNFNQVQSTPRGSYLYPVDRYTVPGDFPWLKPSMCVAQSDTSVNPNQANPFGDIDIFSARALHQFGSSSPWIDDSASESFQPYFEGMGWTDSGSITSEFLRVFGSNGVPVVGDTHPINGGQDSGAFLYGIPYNRTKYDPVFGLSDPLATINQEERFWPSGSGYANGQVRPQYAWECMFRRHQGRIQVAIFVYRVAAANTVGGYVAVAQPDAENSPPLPVRFDIPIDASGSQDYPEVRPWTPLGAADANGDGEQDGDSYLKAEVVGTGPETVTGNEAVSLPAYELGWQAPGQWILDVYGRTHRVVQGRRNKLQGPVRLARPVSEQSQTSSTFNWAVLGEDPSDTANNGIQNEVRSIWFIPPIDDRGITLTPVYMTVREL